MGHCIRAIIGARDSVRRLAEDWLREVVELPQDFGMILMTNGFLEDLGELMEVSDDLCFPELENFTEEVKELIERYSFRTKLAYIETDYFGGVGTQAGVLYENGRITIEPRRGEGTINILLKELGVWHYSDKDEFDMLELGKHRHMPY
ncbi:MAG: hypothetical protein K2G32_07260 [Oscillospiraceae bacterium]|nr:hypothetical protein [Oscillospiraceae bacterium]